MPYYAHVFLPEYLFASQYLQLAEQHEADSALQHTVQCLYISNPELQSGKKCWMKWAELKESTSYGAIKKENKTRAVRWLSG